jgi:phosphohistidine phosphatase
MEYAGGAIFMKTLLLMRHAKSSWKQEDVSDHERPLNKRGKKDAPLMAKLILEKELAPQLILSSSALRARLTADAIAETVNFIGEVEFLDDFYMAEPGTYLEKLRSLPGDLERVMIIGHNPGLEGLVQILSHRVESLSTSAIAYLVLPIKEWNELSEDTDGDLIELWRPRDFREKAKK